MKTIPSGGIRSIPIESNAAGEILQRASSARSGREDFQRIPQRKDLPNRPAARPEGRLRRIKPGWQRAREPPQWSIAC